MFKFYRKDYSDMFNMQKKLHTSSLPAPVNMGVGNDQRRSVFEYKTMSPAEFLGKVADFCLLGRSTLVCDFNLEKEKILLRQMMGYLHGEPRILVCSESQISEVEYLKRSFPAGIVNSGEPIVNGIYLLPLSEPAQKLKDLLSTYPDVYFVIYLSRVTLDTAALNLLNSLGLGYMLLIDRDPSNMVERADDRTRLFCTDYVFAGGYPGMALQSMSSCLWSYEKLVTQHITNVMDNSIEDHVSITQMNNLVRTPVFFDYELQTLSNNGKFLVADRLRQRAYVSDIFSQEKEKVSWLSMLFGGGY
jgi:hypothetical protein